MSSSLLDPNTFELLSPSRYISFDFPHPNPSLSPLRIAVLDSPHPTPSSTTAAMLVPPGRHSDWIFSTPAGHLQLLLSSSPPPLSRLILLSSSPSPSPLLPLLLALSPKSAFSNGIPNIPFLEYDDGVTETITSEKAIGPIAGEMLVEDVNIKISESTTTEWVRRLRFKRMPNLVQSQVRLRPLLDSSNSSGLGLGLGFRSPDPGSLSQPYLAAMAASLSLIEVEPSRRPRALCLGVGGGDLLMFLRLRLGFEVLGVEADYVVLDVARRHFGLVEGELLRVCVGDGIELMERFARDGVRGFDAVMVDLDAVDAVGGISAPTVEFVSKNVLLAARMVLGEHGVLVVNVIAPERSSYIAVVDAFREVFSELYEVDVGNGENYVLVAAVSPVQSAATMEGEAFTCKLKDAVGERYMDCIKRI